MFQEPIFIKPLFSNLNKPASEKIESLTEIYSDTVIGKSIFELQYLSDLEWFTCVSENRSRIGTRMDSKSNSVLKEEIISVTDFYTILNECSYTEWHDPLTTLNQYLLLLSSNIETKYDSDSALVSSLSETPAFSQDSLRETYNTLRNTKEEYGFVHPIEKQYPLESQYDSLFARFAMARGLMVEKSIDPFVWKELSLSQDMYILVHLVNTESEHTPVVGKITSDSTYTTPLSAIIPTLDPDRTSSTVTVTEYQATVLSYDDSIKGLYTELNLSDPNSKMMVSPDLEDIIELSESNPLPL